MINKKMTREEIFEFAESEFGSNPEYLWAKFPSYAVLRNSKSKWYAVIMDVPKCKIGFDGNEIVEIINIKCDPILVGSLRSRKGFCPAYHMNKEKWISILLDGSVDYDEIKELICLSYELSMKK